MNLSTSAALRLPVTFRALRHRNYRLFFFGQLISVIGTWMQTIAQQWLVYRLTGSAAMLGMVNLMSLLPLIPFSLWGGSLADRFPKRSVVVMTQTAAMVQALALAALTWAGMVQVWHVLLLALLLGAVNAVDMPARQAFVVEMVDDRADITNAIGLNSTIFNAGRAIGPAIAGVTVATTGEAGAFFINGITFLPVILGLLLMRLPPNRPLNKGTNMAAHLAEGLRYVLNNQTVLILMSLVGISAFLSMPYTTLLPVFAERVLKESAQPFLNLVCNGSQSFLSCQSPDALTYGLLMATSGLGAVLGALFVASLPTNARRGHWLTVGNLAFPTLLLAMAASRSFLATTLLMVLIGISFVAQNALANTLIQITVPDNLRGRVMSLYSLTFQGMMRLGGLQAGAIGDLIGAPLTVGLGATVSLVYGAFVALRYPKVRNLV